MTTKYMNAVYPSARDYGYEVCTTMDTPVSLSNKIRAWIGVRHMNAGQAGTVADRAAARVFEQIEAGHFKPAVEA